MVKGDRYERGLFPREIHEVSVYETQNTLVRHNKDGIFLPLYFVNDRNQPVNDILRSLYARV